MKKRNFFAVFSLLTVLSFAVLAEAPRVGKKAARDYLAPPPSQLEEVEDPVQNNNVMMLHIGSYVSSQSYEWNKSGREDNVAKANYGVTYLFTDWHNFDLNLRAEFSEYAVGTDKDRAVKFSVVPMLTFPQSQSQFPIYFGIGAGMGIFFQQAKDESNLSFDYQLVIGSRFMDLWGSTGLFIEYGLKNHLLILTDGQLNGSALTAGAVFTF